jgi:hypothetical protein
MKRLTHTPGPWAVEYGRRAKSGGRTVRVIRPGPLGGGALIANGIVGGGDAEWIEGNARLIAAAPDLVAALEQAFDELQAAAGGPQDQTEEEAALLAMCREALLKAGLP